MSHAIRYVVFKLKSISSVLQDFLMCYLSLQQATKTKRSEAVHLIVLNFDKVVFGNTLHQKEYLSLK